MRAEPVPGDARRSLYDARDIAGLVERCGRGRARRAVAASTTNWGEPILRSSLTRIADGTFFYRGQDAVVLSRTAAMEDVAGLLWGEVVPMIPAPAQPVPSGPDPFGHCLHTAVVEAAHGDWASHRGHAVQVAARLLGVMAQAASGGVANGPGSNLHERMAMAWHLDSAGTDLIRRALVLCAGHELNASAYATRVVASTGASLGGLHTRRFRGTIWSATRRHDRPGPGIGRCL